MRKNDIHVSLILLYLLLMAMAPSFSHAYDMRLWKEWASCMKIFGMPAMYEMGVGYPPFFLYVLWGFSALMEGIPEVEANIIHIKKVVLIFDFIPALVLLTKTGYRAGSRIFLLLLNFAYLYNTLIWGQVDAIYTAFVFLSIIILWKRPYWGSLFFVFAFITKPQSVIFLPVLLLCLWASGLKLKKLPALLGFTLGALTVSILPVIAGGTLDEFVRLYTGAAGRFQIVSVNAYNLWYILIEEPVKTLYYSKAFGLTHQEWGLLLFLPAVAAALYPLLVLSRLKRKNAIAGNDFLRLLFLVAGLLVLLFFYLNTQMHERYSHPAMLFFFCYWFFGGRIGPYLLVSLAYLMNLEALLQYFEIDHEKLPFFNPLFVSGIYLFTIATAFVLLFREHKKVTGGDRLINFGSFGR